MIVVADLQDPPELIPAFIEKWEQGNEIVIGVKNKSRESKWMFFIRKYYYRLMSEISETEHIENFYGFGLYDKTFIARIRQIEDPIPYFRGLVAEMGGKRAEISYVQPSRTKGRSSYNFYKLYNVAMLGLVNHSKVPLRLASFTGFFIAGISLLVALVYFHL